MSYYEERCKKLEGLVKILFEKLYHADVELAKEVVRTLEEKPPVQSTQSNVATKAGEKDNKTAAGAAEEVENKLKKGIEEPLV